MAEVVTNGGAETLAQGELTGGLVTTVAMTSIGEHDEASLNCVNFLLSINIHSPPDKGGGFGD